MYFKIVNKTLYKCDKVGNPNQFVASDVSFGTYDEKTNSFLVTKFDGKLELRDYNGNMLRLISTSAIEARFDNSDIIVRTKDGKTCVMDRNGNLRRYL